MGRAIFEHLKFYNNRTRISSFTRTFFYTVVKIIDFDLRASEWNEPK